jgi:hypothetical protein
VGKLKKVGIGFGIVVLSFLVLIVFAADQGGKIIEKEAEELRNMSAEELMSLSVEWTYADLMRNMDNYEGKIIFVEGEVTKIQRDVGSLNLCINAGSYSCDDFMFVGVNGITNWLEDDRLSGFVEVINLKERGTKSPITGGEWVGSGEYVPKVKEVKLTCSNC